MLTQARSLYLAYKHRGDKRPVAVLTEAVVARPGV